jgi:hypothetical protein
MNNVHQRLYGQRRLSNIFFAFLPRILRFPQRILRATD